MYLKLYFHMYPRHRSLSPGAAGSRSGNLGGMYVLEKTTVASVTRGLISRLEMALTAPVTPPWWQKPKKMVARTLKAYHSFMSGRRPKNSYL